VIGKAPGKLFGFSGSGVREVYEKNLFVLVADELNAFVHATLPDLGTVVANPYNPFGN
jgi:hypothetical protein